MVDPTPAQQAAVPSTAEEGGADRRQGDRRETERFEPNRREGEDDRRAEARVPAEPRAEGRSGDERRQTEDRRDTERFEPNRRESDERRATPPSGRPDVATVASGEVPPAADASDAHAPAARSHVLASPAVRQRARDLGIDLAEVRTVADRIRHADLDAYLLYNGGSVSRTSGPRRQDEIVRVVGLRRKIAENMAEAKRRIPHFTLVEEFDVTALEQTRAMMNADRGSNPKLTMLPFLIVAMARTLGDYPQINARYDDDENVVYRSGAVHMGMATQTPNGLMVPVLRNAETKSVWDLAGEIVRLAEAARTGKASRDELSGSTITISSLGPMGGITSTPVINRPEVAIIAVNKLEEKPVVIDGELEIRKRMNLSLSCDHRVVDGWDAASFLQDMKKLIENPLKLLSL
ncbi:2-oxo acid dehydrogenase subunit E2 [Sphingomonas parva]|uniref:Dihydrolipoyllysine-residue succinyltransferase component of 2-oxoglutarate dehydrogenase complex n=1 Tax=Sphingomonas parva TaxID=2555898 RepID=A0A4Y8ZUM8_9SPHN|nr:2-oxo acid dehydrogenase subunit E2 [Sphingomonas parva]